MFTPEQTVATLATDSMTVKPVGAGTLNTPAPRDLDELLRVVASNGTIRVVVV